MPLVDEKAERVDEKLQKRRDAMRAVTKAIRSLQVRFREAVEEKMRDDGLSLAQLRLLFAIQHKPEVSAAELARQCEVRPQSMQALLARALREGWIARGHSERDSRILTAELTEKGVQVLEHASAAVTAIEEVAWAGVKTGELRELKELLDLVASRVGRETPQRCE